MFQEYSHSQSDSVVTFPKFRRNLKLAHVWINYTCGELYVCMYVCMYVYVWVCVCGVCVCVCGCVVCTRDSILIQNTNTPDF
jgi:hypothetical protein